MTHVNFPGMNMEKRNEKRREYEKHTEHFFTEFGCSLRGITLSFHRKTELYHKTNILNIQFIWVNMLYIFNVLEAQALLFPNLQETTMNLTVILHKQSFCITEKTTFLTSCGNKIEGVLTPHL